MTIKTLLASFIFMIVFAGCGDPISKPQSNNNEDPQIQSTSFKEPAFAELYSKKDNFAKAAKFFAGYRDELKKSLNKDAGTIFDKLTKLETSAAAFAKAKPAQKEIDDYDTLLSELEAQLSEKMRTVSKDQKDALTAKGKALSEELIAKEETKNQKPTDTKGVEQIPAKATGVPSAPAKSQAPAKNQSAAVATAKKLLGDKLGGDSAQVNQVAPPAPSGPPMQKAAPGAPGVRPPPPSGSPMQKAAPGAPGVRPPPPGPMKKTRYRDSAASDAGQDKKDGGVAPKKVVTKTNGSNADLMDELTKKLLARKT